MQVNRFSNNPHWLVIIVSQQPTPLIVILSYTASLGGLQTLLSFINFIPKVPSLWWRLSWSLMTALLWLHDGASPTFAPLTDWSFASSRDQLENFQHREVRKYLFKIAFPSIKTLIKLVRTSWTWWSVMVWTCWYSQSVSECLFKTFTRPDREKSCPYICVQSP